MRRNILRDIVGSYEAFDGLVSEIIQYYVYSVVWVTRKSRGRPMTTLDL